MDPWLGYLETVPASRFLNGVGVGFNSSNADLVCEMLSRHGCSVTRFEIGWCQLNPDGTLTNASIIRPLQAFQKWGLRPIILLNAHHGVPCPMSFFSAQLASAAAQGARSVTFTNTSGFSSGYTGICNLTQYKACEVFITSVNGNTCTLSKPLPVALSANQRVQMATLQYKPFSAAGSAHYKNTVAGWQAYVFKVAQTAVQYLGAGNFDLEVWNELTFGSDFLNINNYYSPPVDNHYYGNARWAAIVQATADIADANSSVFSGVEISDGFASTVPWPSSAQEPARITAISKHPYPPNE